MIHRTINVYLLLDQEVETISGVLTNNQNILIQYHTTHQHHIDFTSISTFEKIKSFVINIIRGTFDHLLLKTKQKTKSCVYSSLVYVVI